MSGFSVARAAEAAVGALVAAGVLAGIATARGGGLSRAWQRAVEYEGGALNAAAGTALSLALIAFAFAVLRAMPDAWRRLDFNAQSVRRKQRLLIALVFVGFSGIAITMMVRLLVVYL